MSAAIAMLLAVGLSCAAEAGISLYGDGYDSVNKDWLSNTTDDIDANGLGTDGFIFFGDFVESGTALQINPGNQNPGQDQNENIIGINEGTQTSDSGGPQFTVSAPSYVATAATGANSGNVGQFASYEMIDSPVTLDGTDARAGNLLTASGEALEFTISGLAPGVVVRVGILGTTINDFTNNGRFGLGSIALTDGADTETVDVSGLNLTATDNSVGWVFFDIDADGDYSINVTDDYFDNVNTGIGGVTFDSFEPGPGAALLFAPGALSLELDAPETSVGGIIKASYYAGLSTSNEIEIQSLVVDSGFSASVVDSTLGLGDLNEDILVNFDNSVGGLAGGETATSTLEITWSEAGSGMSHTTNIPVDVTNNDPIVGFVGIDVVEEDWFFFDFEGLSTFSSPDPSGYTVNVGDGNQEQTFPAEIQQFDTDFDMSKVGQKLTAEFDVVMSTTVASFDKDFRFGFFDTNKNVQIISMNDLGVISGSSMSTKIGNAISYNNGNGGVFVNGDYATLCILYGAALDIDSGSITNGLVQGVSNHFKFSIERISENELFIVTDWSDDVSSVSSSATLDETSTVMDVAEYLPVGGYDSFDGFGLQIHELESGADYTLSNFSLTYTVPQRASFEFGVSSITLEPSGDVTLTLTQPIIGASYLVRAGDDLVAWDEVGSYVASAPGVIVLPAADFAAFVGEKGFFQVELQATPAE